MFLNSSEVNSTESILADQVQSTEKLLVELQEDLGELESNSAYTPIDFQKLKNICERNNFNDYAGATKPEEIDVNKVKETLSKELKLMQSSLANQTERLQQEQSLNSKGYVAEYSDAIPNKKYVAEYSDAIPNKKLAKALLILGLLLAVSSAAVLVALYMPNHMPTVINDIVTNLSPFYHDLILGCAYGAGALGLVGALYKGTEIYKEKSLALKLFGKKENETAKQFKVLGELEECPNSRNDSTQTYRHINEPSIVLFSSTKTR